MKLEYIHTAKKSVRGKVRHYLSKFLKNRRFPVFAAIFVSMMMVVSAFALVANFSGGKGGGSILTTPSTTSSISVVSAPNIAYLGQKYYLNLSFASNVTSLNISWGDGSVTQYHQLYAGTNSFNHVYQNPGSYYIYFTSVIDGVISNNSNYLVPVHTYGSSVSNVSATGLLRLEPSYSANPFNGTSRAFLTGSTLTFAVGYYSNPLNTSYHVISQYVKLEQNGAIIDVTSQPYQNLPNSSNYVMVFPSESTLSYASLGAGYYVADLVSNYSADNATGVLISGTSGYTSYYYDFYVGNGAAQTTPSTNASLYTSAEYSYGNAIQLDGAIAYYQNSLEVLYNIYQTLVGFNGSSSSQVEPYLAAYLPTTSNGGISSSYTSFSAKSQSGVPYIEYVSPDQNYTFHIRNAYFQNGQQITAWDVMYSIARTLLLDSGSPGTPGWILAQYLLPGDYYSSNTFYNITQNMTVDNTSNNITFHFQKPVATQLAYDLLMGPGAFVMDPGALTSEGKGLTWTPSGFQSYKSQGNENGNPNYYLSSTVASGPYEVSYMQQNAYIVLKTNPEFVSPGPWYSSPSYTTVKILYLSNPGYEAQLMSSGAASSIMYENNSSINSLATSSSVNLYTMNSMDLFFYTFNANINTAMLRTIVPTSNVPQTFFDSLLVRKVFAYSYDYSTYVNQYLNGATGGISIGKEYAGVLPSGMTYNQSMAALNASTGNVPYYSISSAVSFWNQFENGSTSMFTAMGLSTSANGSVTYNGSPIVVPIFVPSSDSADLAGATLWASVLQKVIPGASFPVIQVSFEDLIAAYLVEGSNPMPVSWGGWAPDYPYPTDYLLPIGLPQNTSTYMGPADMTPYWFNNSASGNPLYGQKPMEEQYQNFTLMNQDYNNLTYYPPNAEQMAYSINELLVNETFHTYLYQGYTNLIVGKSVSTSSVINYEENPFLNSNGELMFYSLRSAGNTVTFTETGLPSGTTWFVNLSNGESLASISSFVTVQLVNGSYTYVAGVQSSKYSITPQPSNFTVRGSPVSIGISFTLELYSVTFMESGLPAGSVWILNDSQAYNYTGQYFYTSSSQTISFGLPDGTYTFMAVNYTLAEVKYVTFTVSGASETVNINFGTSVPNEYNITFVEKGLTTGSVWDINDSQAYNLTGKYYYQTSGTSISIPLPNGTYNFYAMDNSLSLTRQINFNVSGSSEIVYVYFNKTQTNSNYYTVNFAETGLPSGITWNLAANGSTYSTSNSNIALQLSNGTYGYSISTAPPYFALKGYGNITVAGKGVDVNVTFEKMPEIVVDIQPSGANFTMGNISGTSEGVKSVHYMDPGNYTLYVSDRGYIPYSNSYTFSHGQVYYLNVSLQKEQFFGILEGFVNPQNATVMANGIVLPVTNGMLNVSLSPGTYYITASASGYSAFSGSVSIKNNSVTSLNITLKKSLTSYTVYGYVNPYNASVTINGTSAFVNSTGYFQITIPAGDYVISFYAPGYFAYSKNISVTSSMEINANLTLQPAPTSTVSSNNVTANGFNVTIANITISSDMVNLTYTSGPNGTLSISLPYSLVSNLTVSQILGSKVYINGTQYSNFTVTITNSYTVILTVSNLSGDPVITWIYNSAVSLSSPPAKKGPQTGPLDYYALAAIIVVLAATAIGFSSSAKKRRKGKR